MKVDFQCLTRDLLLSLRIYGILKDAEFFLKPYGDLSTASFYNDKEILNFL
jgi:hypothetical protein